MAHEWLAPVIEVASTLGAALLLACIGLWVVAVRGRRRVLLQPDLGEAVKGRRARRFVAGHVAVVLLASILGAVKAPVAGLLFPFLLQSLVWRSTWPGRETTGNGSASGDGGGGTT